VVNLLDTSASEGKRGAPSIPHPQLQLNPFHGID